MTKTRNCKTQTNQRSRAIFYKSDVSQQNQLFTSQLQELVRHFSSIENYQIRQYAINLVREVAKCESEEKVKTYMDEMMREIL